jgi:hypothetical protein
MGEAMAGFDEATAIDGVNGTYQAQLDPEWTVSGNPHGGYLLAILARAAVAADGKQPHPLSASAVYASPPEVGPATVVVESLRRGRTASQSRARLVQGERTRLEALFTLGRLDEGDAPRWVDASPPPVTAAEQCPVSPTEPPGSGVTVAMLNQVEQRLDVAAITAAGGGEIRGWLGFADGTPFDPVSLLYVADSFPPATFTLGSVGWVPTLELTAYVRAVPAPGRLRVRQRVRMVSAPAGPAPTSDQRPPMSLVDQVCEVWDSRDRLVVQATQLALVRMP